LSLQPTFDAKKEKREGGKEALIVVYRLVCTISFQPHYVLAEERKEKGEGEGEMLVR